MPTQLLADLLHKEGLRLEMMPVDPMVCHPSSDWWLQVSRSLAAQGLHTTSTTGGSATSVLLKAGRRSRDGETQ